MNTSTVRSLRRRSEKLAADTKVHIHSSVRWVTQGTATRKKDKVTGNDTVLRTTVVNKEKGRTSPTYPAPNPPAKVSD